MGSLVVLLLAERARSEGARSTRAIEDQPGYPLKEVGTEGTRNRDTQSPCPKQVLDCSRLIGFRFNFLQAAQTDYPARSQPKNRPEAYPLGYVEDLFEVRTPLGVCFSSLPRRRPSTRT